MVSSIFKKPLGNPPQGGFCRKFSSLYWFLCNFRSDLAFVNALSISKRPLLCITNINKLLRGIVPGEI